MFHTTETQYFTSQKTRIPWKIQKYLVSTAVSYREHMLNERYIACFWIKLFWLNDDEQKYLDLKIQKDKRSRDYHNILVRFFTTNEWSIRSSLLKIKIIIFVRLKFWWDNLICGLFSWVKEYADQVFKSNFQCT